MALKWFDGGEVWGSNTYQARAYIQSDAVANTPGRILPGLFHLAISGGGLTTPSLGVQNTWYSGFGIKNFAGGWTYEALSGAAEQCRIEFEVTTGDLGVLKIYRGATLIDTSSEFTAGTIWGFVEVKFVARAGVNGSYEVWLNQTSIMSGTGVDLADTGSDGADAFQMGGGTSFLLDDWYILDDTGTLNTSRLGEQVCVGIVPTADGHQIDFTPSEGIDNFALVDDGPVNPDDSDFVSSLTVGHEDYYAYENPPSTGLGTVNGLRIVHGAKLDTAGTRKVQPRYYNGTLEFDLGGDFTIDGTSIFEHTSVVDANPDTGVKWTKVEISNGEFGMKVTV